jgi:hypothetical protein
LGNVAYEARVLEAGVQYFSAFHGCRLCPPLLRMGRRRHDDQLAEQVRISKFSVTAHSGKHTKSGAKGFRWNAMRKKNHCAAPVFPVRKKTISRHPTGDGCEMSVDPFFYFPVVVTEPQ